MPEVGGDYERNLYSCVPGKKDMYAVSPCVLAALIRMHELNIYCSAALSALTPEKLRAEEKFEST